MKIQIISVGRPRKDIYNATLDFIKRTERFCRIEHIWVKGSKLDGSIKKEQEAEQIKKIINPEEFSIIMTREGKPTSSVELSDLIKRTYDDSKNMNFIIGGAEGFSEDFKKMSNYKISMSKLTIQHDIALLLASEQIYRAFTIIKGLPYHR